MQDRGNIAVDQFQTVTPVSCYRLIGKPMGIQRPVKPVATPISCKHTASPVAPMGGGSQPHN